MAEPSLAASVISQTLCMALPLVAVRSVMVLRILHGEGLRGMKTVRHEAVCWSMHVKLWRTTQQQEMLESARACLVV